MTAQPPTHFETRVLQAAVIGLGVGEQHAHAWAGLPSCRLSAICDVDEIKLDEVGDRFPGVRKSPDPDAILHDPSIDVVSIASYDDVHAAQIITAIEHGKHVFAEKPLCLTNNELHRIRAALHSKGDVRLSSNMILRRSPRFREIKSMIDGGEFGDVYHLEGEYCYGRLHKITHGWRGKIDDYSVTLGGGVHMVDLILWLTGDRVEEVACFGNRISSRGSAFRYNDLAVAILRFAGGRTAKVTANFSCVMPHHHGLSVFGTKATFFNDLPNGRLFTSRQPSHLPRIVTTPHPGVEKGALIGGFVDAILDKAKPEVTEAEVFSTMSVCLSIERSLLEGRPVRVEYA